MPPSLRDAGPKLSRENMFGRINQPQRHAADGSEAEAWAKQPGNWHRGASLGEGKLMLLDLHEITVLLMVDISC